jgi:hypothetical protein
MNPDANRVGTSSTRSVPAACSAAAAAVVPASRIGERRQQRAELLRNLLERDGGDLGSWRVIDDHLADPPPFGRWQPDVEVEPGRPGDLLGEERPDAAPADPPDDLADEPAVGPAVVPVGGARLPHRPLGRQRGRHRVPGQQVIQRDGVVDDRQPGPVRQQPANGDACLARRRELGPVGGHRLIQVELAPLREQVRAGRRGGLGRRVHQLQRVPGPGPAGRGIGQAAPQVDHLAAVPVHADRRPHVTAALEVSAERLPDPLEAWLHIPFDRCHDTDLTTPLPDRARAPRSGHPDLPPPLHSC